MQQSPCSRPAHLCHGYMLVELMALTFLLAVALSLSARAFSSGLILYNRTNAAVHRVQDGEHILTIRITATAGACLPRQAEVVVRRGSGKTWRVTAYREATL